MVRERNVDWDNNFISLFCCIFQTRYAGFHYDIIILAGKSAMPLLI
jgi:hypothetical protein